MNYSPKVMLVANAASPLLVDRVKMSVHGCKNVIWFSESRSVPEADCRCYHYPIISILGPLNKLFSTVYFLWVYFLEKPDVLHVHWAVFPPIIFRKKWKKLVVSVMGSDVNFSGIFGWRRFLVRQAFIRASVITSKSEAMDRVICSLGDFGHKIRRFTWGIDSRYFSFNHPVVDFRSKYNIPSGDVLFFSPRAIKPLYRIPSIVSSFLKLAEKVEGVHLIVAGMYPDPKEEQDIRIMTNDSPYGEKVIMLGMLDKEQMMVAYSSSDAVISYATHDGMPQSLYEAMASYCFPIFTDLGCYAELLTHESNSLLANSNDERSLDSMLSRYIDMRSEKNLDVVLATNAKTAALVASREIEFSRLQRLYHTL